jgi:hypothetical protein
MNIPGELIPITIFITAGVTAIAYPIARAYARSIERRADSSRIPDEVKLRLERMETTLEAVAEQVERVTEGQRFTTKLLSERKNPDDRSA